MGEKVTIDFVNNGKEIELPNLTEMIDADVLEFIEYMKIQAAAESKYAQYKESSIYKGLVSEEMNIRLLFYILYKSDPSVTIEQISHKGSKWVNMMCAKLFPKVEKTKVADKDFREKTTGQSKNK